MMIVNPLSVCRVSAPDQTVGRVRYINEIYYYYYYYYQSIYQENC